MGYQRIRDGFMLIGRHAATLKSNLTGGTYSSIYLIVDKGEGCLIDTGITKDVAEEVSNMIEDSGCVLRYIVLTHDHFDHVANAGAIKTRFGGLVVAHPLDIPMIENPLLLFSEMAQERFPQWFAPDLLTAMNMSQESWKGYQQLVAEYVSFPQSIDEPVEDGQKLVVGDLTLQVLHTPGHSPGSLSLFNQKTGSLYTGDLVRGPGRPYPIGDVKAWEESLLRIKVLGASFLAVGHRPPLRGVGETRNFLLKVQLELLDREQRILDALLLRHTLTVEDITDMLFPDYTRHREYPNRDFTTYCHLLRLQQEGVTTRHRQKGQTAWKLINDKAF